VDRLADVTSLIYIPERISTQEVTMQVAKWGNSLAVRLPAELVRELDLKEGDQIDLVKDDGQVKVRRLARADEVLTGLRRFRGKLPAAERLSRDDAHER
jgi:antitoxin MazE